MKLIDEIMNKTIQCSVEEWVYLFVSLILVFIVMIIFFYSLHLREKDKKQNLSEEKANIIIGVSKTIHYEDVIIPYSKLLIHDSGKIIVTDAKKTEEG